MTLTLAPIPLEAFALDEVLDEVESHTSSVVQVDTVTGTRNEISSARVFGVGVKHRLNSSSKVGRVSAVAEAERQIIGAVNNGNRASEVGGWRGDSAEREEFTNGDSALGGFSQAEDVGVEVGTTEEGDLVADDVVRDEVTIVESAEAVVLVLAGNVEVEASDEGAETVHVQTEAGEDSGGERGWVVGGDGLSDDTAKGVADTDDVGEGSTAKGAVAKHADEVLGNDNLEGALDDIERVRLGRETNSEAVVEESGVTAVCGSVYVAVARSKVPVVTIETDTVGEELNGGGVQTSRGHAHGRTDVEGTRDVLLASNNLHWEWRTSGDEVHEGVGDL